ncbi:hypothetical protein L596_019650 [Steinernema carpocapsae]|uniref:Uncharacterized protein n=1 Tax=Steinernema carpocapsae TaxID=34508 RepID=A0A4U5MRC8_STECR|nr:hypothetical protein L596_019650 [Steinernema carpocapsae]
MGVIFMLNCPLDCARMSARRWEPYHNTDSSIYPELVLILLAIGIGVCCSQKRLLIIENQRPRLPETVYQSS